VEQLLTSMATSLATFGLWRDRPGRVPAAETTSDLRRWGSRLGDSNSRPTHYECRTSHAGLSRRIPPRAAFRFTVRVSVSTGVGRNRSRAARLCPLRARLQTPTGCTVPRTHAT
jgi:hypothetical protein